MDGIEEFLRAPLLPDEAIDEFERSRARVIARHRNWRKNFGAVGLLLDTDEERARALAGNYATEAREVVGVWLAALGPDAGDEERREERAAWVEGYWLAWRETVLSSDDYTALARGSGGAAGPRESFVQVFEELSTRYRDEAASFIREGHAEPPAPSFAARLLAPFAALLRGIGAFFFPTVRR